MLHDDPRICLRYYKCCQHNAISHYHSYKRDSPETPIFNNIDTGAYPKRMDEKERLAPLPSRVSSAFVPLFLPICSVIGRERSVAIPTSSHGSHDSINNNFASLLDILEHVFPAQASFVVARNLGFQLAQLG